MKEQVFDENVLRRQFDLIVLDDEGILLNRESGGVYRLNSTASLIWGGLLAGETIPSIVDRMTRTFRLSSAKAAEDTMAALALPPQGISQSTADRRYLWSAGPHGYGFDVDERRVFDVDRQGQSLKLGLASPVKIDSDEARMHLRSVVPKVLALRGIRVLHASAVEIDGSLLVFSGKSGAGKTTSAKAFAQAGARLVSEDLLVLRPGDGRPEGVVSGESMIRRWVADEGRRLAADPEVLVDCTALDRCIEGERRPIKRILLIDAQRRGGDRMIFEELRGPDALIALLDNVYFASTDYTSWRESFESLKRLVGAVSTATTAMPLGLEALHASVGAYLYSDMTAS